jgi:hypothetical protein
VKHGVPQGSVLGPLLILLYINELPNAIIHNATPILFVEDTSILITSQNVYKFQNDLNTAFGQMTKWFQTNSLFLNPAKHILFSFAVNI